MTQTEHDNTKHDSIIVDTDPHFTIDITTRSITNTKSKKTFLVQYDHNSERFSFDIDRYIEGHDILLCNRIQVHYITISGSSRTKRIGLYEVTDLAAHPDDDTKAYFTWLISENATHYDGAMSFLISFECVDKDAEVIYRWNSNICSSIVIVPGINNNNAVFETYPDELLKWETYLADHFDELKDDLYNTTLPNMVDQRYVERVFATSAEVAAIFALDPSDVNGTVTVATVVQTTGTSTTDVMSQKGTTDAINAAVAGLVVITEVSTAAEMNALLTESNVGKYVKYTGTTDGTYTNGDIYLIEQTN